MDIKDVIETNEILIDTFILMLGGATYGLMEIVYRGYTHWTMVVTGGLCVLTLYKMSNMLLSLPIVMSALIGAAIITAYEFVIGFVVNVKLKWGVWDYSNTPGNIAGQICLKFSALWYIIVFLFLLGVKIISSKL